MIDAPTQRTPAAPAAGRPARLNGRSVTLLAFLAALIWSVDQAGLLGSDLVNEGGWGIAARFVRASIQPDFSPALLRLTLHAALITLSYAVCGTVLSLLLGFVGGIFCSETWWRRHARGCGYRLPWLGIRAALAVPRAIHEAVWGLLFLGILGLDPLSALLAIAVPFGAITAKVYAEILDETPQAALTALHAQGAGPLAALGYGLLPAAFPYLLSYGLYRFECALRAAAVLGLIGAGGLGYQILLSLQSLRYEQVWTFLYALILLVGLTDAWSSHLNRRFNVTSPTGLHAVPRAPRAAAAPRDRSLRGSLLAVAVLIPFCFWYIQADLSRLTAPRTATLLSQTLRDAFPPRLEPTILAELTRLSAETLSMSILAMTVAGLGGLLLSFPAAATFAPPGGPRWLPLLATRGALLVARALSESIWVLLVLFVLFPGILPGAVALGLYNLGVLGRLMAEVAENADDRPLRALRAQGASPAQVFLYGVLPAALPRDLAYVLYRWEVCIRATAVVGIVGAGGLGRLLSEQMTRFDYRGVTTTLLFYLALTFLVDLISAAVRRAVR